jgi:WD40 repeat protein
VRVWSAVTGDPVRVLSDHKALLDGLALSADGRRMVTTALGDKTAHLWDATTGKTIAILEHADDIRSAAFSPDSKRVVTASKDATARIWDSETGQLFATLSGHREAVTSAEFSSDRQHIVTASVDRTARVWRVFPATQDLVDEAKQSLPRCLTREQRTRFFLNPKQPAWCANKWPPEQ